MFLFWKFLEGEQIVFFTDFFLMPERIALHIIKLFFKKNLNA